jgi:uncharacterized protein YdhG (YjbR/CyaY superfamily)
VNARVRTIDEYIAGFPPDVRVTLERLRATIREAAPDATEAIKYGMPAFVLHGNLVYFAAFKHHVGFYPVPSGIEAFREEWSAYDQSKGAVRFAFGTPIPYDLIARTVRFRVAENRQRAAAKKRSPKLEVTKTP